MRSLCWRGAVMAVTVCAFMIPAVQAQVRPAVTKNVDEPGRSPYQVMLKAARGETSCGINFCSFSTPNIPAGKRLVHTGIASTVHLDATGVVQNFRVTVTEGGTSLVTFYLPYQTTFPADPISINNPRRWVSNEQVRIYVEAGQRINASFHTTGGELSLDWPNTVLLTGYLVDLSV